MTSLPCFQAILFLQQLLDFQETAGAMLASQGTYMHGACLGMEVPSPNCLDVFPKKIKTQYAL